MNDEEIRFLYTMLVKYRRNLITMRVQSLNYTDGERPLWISNAIRDAEEGINSIEKKLQELNVDLSNEFEVQYKDYSQDEIIKLGYTSEHQKDKIYDDYNHMKSTIVAVVDLDIHGFNINRGRLINCVENDWIKPYNRRMDSKSNEIKLNFTYRDDLIKNPWRYAQGLPDNKNKLITDSSILKIFDEAKGSLLIVGQAGAGKSTLLIKLAEFLINRVRSNQEMIVPVVLSLVSWDNKYNSLDEWMVNEIHEKYYVDKGVARLWISSRYILPLIDGLDEVDDKYRNNCILLINNYIKLKGKTSCVVCCRENIYINNNSRLILNEAISVNPIEKNLLNNMFNVKDILLEEVIEENSMRTPLMVKIINSIYNNQSRENNNIDNWNKSQNELWGLYIDSMLRRSEKNYKNKKIIKHLQWIARNIEHSSGFRLLYTNYENFSYLGRYNNNKILFVIVKIILGLGSFISTAAILLGFMNSYIAISLSGIISLLLIRMMNYLSNVGESPFMLVMIQNIFIYMLFFPIFLSRSNRDLFNPIISFEILILIFMIGSVRLIDNIESFKIFKLSTKYKSKISINKSIINKLSILTVIITLLSYINIIDIKISIMFITGYIIYSIVEYISIRDTDYDDNLYSIWLGLLLKNTGAILMISVFAGVMGYNFTGFPGNILIGIGFGFLALLIGITSKYTERLLVYLSIKVTLLLNGYLPWRHRKFLDYCVEKSLLYSTSNGYIFIHRLLLEYLIEKEKQDFIVKSSVTTVHTDDRTFYDQHSQ